MGLTRFFRSFNEITHFVTTSATTNATTSADLQSALVYTRLLFNRTELLFSLSSKLGTDYKSAPSFIAFYVPH
jgi:hypothetical protein